MMNFSRIKLILICTLAAVYFFYFMFGRSESRDPANSENSTFQLLQWAEIIPYSSRLKDYFDALGIRKHGAGNRGSNPGLIEFNSQLLRGNSCFAELASKFYSELQLIDLKWILAHPEKFKNVDDVFKKGPSLSDKLTSQSSPSEGFVWKLAMRYSNNDPNLAVHLLGICGHDNVSIDLDLPAVQESIIKKNLLKQIENRFSSEFFQYVNFRTEKVKCPIPASPMYFPGALGEDFDISETLKNKIIKSQAPSLGGAALPAKYYHVYGALLSTCLLYQNDVPDFIVSNIHRRTINAYRSRTSCQYIRAGLDLYESALEKRKEILFQIPNFAERLSKDNLVCYPPMNELDMKFCNIFTNKKSISSKEIKERILNGLTRGDAAYLVDLNSDSLEALKKCDDIDLSLRLETSVNRALNSRCPMLWDKGRCENAMQAISGWSVDFEWTREQHSLGKTFAKEQCKSIKDHSRVQNSCNALNLLNSKLNTLPEETKKTPAVVK